MSYDSSREIYHLAPNGWVKTYEKVAGFVTTDNQVPGDRVETWQRTMDQASGYSREYVEWRCVWASPDVAREKRDELRKRFPMPENNPRASIGTPL